MHTRFTFLCSGVLGLGLSGCLGDPSALEDTSEIGSADGEVAITRIIPLRFVQALPCDPGPGCSDNVSADILAGAVKRANEAFAPAGVKFWVKSNERYFMPKFAYKSSTSYDWAAVKSTALGHDTLLDVFPNMPANAWHDTAEERTQGEWLHASAAWFADPEEIVLWVHRGSSSSSGAFPERGRHLRLSGGPIGDQWATSHLAHELGHFFGVRHPAAGLTGLDPVTDQPWTYADQWDLLYCEPTSPGSYPTFFVSREHFVSASCPSLARITSGSNCFADDAFGRPTCTLSGHDYSAGFWGVSGVLYDLGIAHTPPASITYGTNIMSYYSHFSWWDGSDWTSRDTRSPSRFSDSQIRMIARHASDDVPYYASVVQDSLLTHDGQVPAGALPGATTSLRSQLGTHSEDFIYFSFGDLTFESQTEPIYGTGYEPEAGDLDGDGLDDIVWYYPGDGSLRTWFANGDRSFTHDVLPAVGGGGHTLFVGDFDGNGRDDLFFYRPGSGTDYIRWSTPGTPGYSLQATNVSGSYTPVAANFDGQHGDDILWYHAGAGVAHLWWSTGTASFEGETHVPFGSGFSPIAGDFDGDGRGDVFWYAPGSAADRVDFGEADGSFDSHPASVHGSYLPLAGDYDGDGADDIFWDAVNHTTDYIWTGTGVRTDAFDTSARASVHGAFDPVVGKFDGVDAFGRDTSDIFWYRD